MRGRRGPKTQSVGGLGQASDQVLGDNNIGHGPFWLMVSHGAHRPKPFKY